MPKLCKRLDAAAEATINCELDVEVLIKRLAAIQTRVIRLERRQEHRAVRRCGLRTPSEWVDLQRLHQTAPASAEAVAARIAKQLLDLLNPDVDTADALPAVSAALLHLPLAVSKISLF